MRIRKILIVFATLTMVVSFIATTIKFNSNVSPNLELNSRKGDSAEDDGLM